MINKNSLFVLLLANLVPIVGVLFFEWSLFGVLFFFWLENIAIGFWNIPKMWKVKKPNKDFVSGLPKSFSDSGVDLAQKITKIFLIPFFIIHFGIFTFGHGAFIVFLFGPVDITILSMLVGLVSLFVSHGYSFFVNFVGKREYLHMDIGQQMFSPYKRIVVVHVTIVLGAFPTMLLGSPVFALLILVIIKTLVDLWSHKKEHTF